MSQFHWLPILAVLMVLAAVVIAVVEHSELLTLVLVVGAFSLVELHKKDSR